MKADDWWKTAVFYQVYPRSFQDSSGDGTGDLRGIEQRLDYLASTLGVDVVWLSPFYPSPMIDGGYDVSHLTDVDPLFGALQDFDALLQKAHQLGLKLVLAGYVCRFKMRLLPGIEYRPPVQRIHRDMQTLRIPLRHDITE